MYNKPKISIIIPVYKTEKVIGRCLESLINQTFQDFEVIIVDDNSPDNSINVVESHKNIIKDIKIIRNKENKGPMVCRRTGYEIASGEYLIFLDSDDTLPKNALELLYNAIRGDKKTIVISGYQYVWAGQNKILKQYPKMLGIISPKECLYQLVTENLTHNLAYSIFSADLFDREFITIPDQKHYEDLILFYQLVVNSKRIKIINAITYNYHQDGESSTRSPMTYDKLLQYTRVCNFMYEFLSKYGIDKNAILKRVIGIAARNYRYEGGKSSLLSLNKGIKKEMRISKSLKYLTIKQWIVYVMMKKTLLLSSILKLVFRKR